MSYSIHYDKQPRKFLKKHTRQHAKRFLIKIRTVLSINTVPHDAKTIANAHGVFRIRIGNFRVLYRVNHHEKKIVVLRIQRREQSYK